MYNKLIFSHLTCSATVVDVVIMLSLSLYVELHCEKYRYSKQASHCCRVHQFAFKQRIGLSQTNKKRQSAGSGDSDERCMMNSIKWEAYFLSYIQNNNNLLLLQMLSTQTHVGY